MNGFANNDSDQSESKPSAFQPANSIAKARNGGLVETKNMTEAEKKARWPQLPAVKPSDKEVINIAQNRKPKDQGEMPLGIWQVKSEIRFQIP